MPDAMPDAPARLVAAAWQQAHDLAEKELGPAYPRHFYGPAGAVLLDELYGVADPTAEALDAVVRRHLDGLKPGPKPEPETHDAAPDGSGPAAGAPEPGNPG